MTEKRTVLFAPAKFVNDITGRFYNRMAKSVVLQFCTLRGSMTDEGEFAARSQLKWTREGDAWILLYRRRRMGRVVLDKDHQGMWRSVKSSGPSDMANLFWSKDNVMAQAIREVAWDAANDPRKCPVKRGFREQKSPPVRLNAA